MVASVDELLADMIVEGMVSQPDADDYLTRPAREAASSCSSSCTQTGKCNKLNGTAELLIVDKYNALSSRGLSTKTTAGFSEYRTELVKLNNSLSPHDQPAQ